MTNGVPGLAPLGQTCEIVNSVVKIFASSLLRVSSTMTLFEFQASRIVRIAVAFADFIGTTRPDKLDWRVPLEGAETRTAFEMVGECIRANRFFAALLR